MTDHLQAILNKLDALLERSGPPRRFLSVAEAAAYSSLSDDSIRRLIERGDLTALRPMAGKILIDRDELDRLILGSTRQPTHSRGRCRA